MLKNCSHVTLTSNDCPRMQRFLAAAFGLQPKYANDEFFEVVLPSGFRLAVFKVLGKTADYFNAEGARGTLALGVTTDDVDALFAALEPKLAEFGARVSGPPKEHPWGEKSFLLIDPDGNRWEIAQSPSESGMLVDR